MITYVPKVDHEFIWEFVTPYLIAALERGRGRYTLQDIKEALEEDRYHLWIVVLDHKIIATLITEIIDYPQSRSLRINFGGGKLMDEWFQEMFDTMNRAAKDVGATMLELVGRPGWQKIFKDVEGAKVDSVNMSLEVK
jgi:hypothetical protein